MYLDKSSRNPSETRSIDQRINEKMFEIQGKFALITGGSQGLGLEYSKELLKNGLAGVVIADVQEEKGYQVVAELNKQYGENKAVFVRTDVTKADEMENAYKVAISKYGALDLVINNAGILKDCQFELEIDINCTAVVRSTLMAMKCLGKNNGGRGGVIVNVSSIAGLEEIDFCPIYVGTKHFVQSFTRSLANPVYYNQTGVTFRVICPGVTETALIWESGKYLLQGFPGLDKEAEAALQVLPTQNVEDVAKAMIKVITMGENGSVWSPEGGELYRINIPSRSSIRTKDSL